ncbi:hypothetical protein J4418_01615 [Candidatus Woesearchaeota archaeon]|nr:hypothetical protein [Candidatus Woesearchaeota archaeon]
MKDLIDYNKLKREFDDCYRPMYFFHDDPDGLCSFLLCYKYVGEGVGIPIKSMPVIDLKFVSKVQYYQPDKIFVLDIANINQDFIDNVKTSIVWVDHHDLVKRDKVIIFNPREKFPDIYIPATYLCYKTLGGLDWINMVGCVGDHYLPSETKEFLENYPDLISKAQTKDIDKVKFDSKLGILVEVFSFILKGNTPDIKKTVKVLTRIKTPYEILEQKTAAGKYVWKQYEKVRNYYLPYWNVASKIKPKKKVVLFEYVSNKFTFASDIATRLSHKYRKCLIIVARRADDEFRGSLRTRNGDFKNILPKALEGIRGHGGGHEKAAGFVVKIEDFNQFVENLTKLIN